ncbi:MAG TPA: hypothetical protein VGN43_05545 [Steroidobacteraceae bacterium]|jgi:hypothetical protein|nr:hypothetical protein [Steroidobacteraceae bacterium]
MNGTPRRYGAQQRNARNFARPRPLAALVLLLIGLGSCPTPLLTPTGATASKVAR